jgi:transposase-like protein
MAKQKRRAFTKEYKTEVLEPCRKSGKSIGAIAKDLDSRSVSYLRTDSERGSHTNFLTRPTRPPTICTAMRLSIPTRSPKHESPSSTGRSGRSSRRASIL